MYVKFKIFQMARTQKNKATSAHLGLLKARLAKLKRELITPKGGGGGPGEGNSLKVDLLLFLHHSLQMLHLLSLILLQN